MKKTYTQENIKTIISLYEDGKTTWQVAALVGCAQSFVINTLKRNNIRRRSNKEYITTTKYNYNKEVFNKIDSEAGAYFLGLLYADGNLFAGNAYEITISLQQEDKDILECYRNIVAPNAPIKFRKKQNQRWKNQFLLRINNKEIFNQLIRLGCLPNKSLILQFPDSTIVPDHLLNHFIRGYSDGDGSIYNYIKHNKTSKYSTWCWSVVSTKKFCNTLNIKMSSLLGEIGSISLLHKSNNITSVLKIGGNRKVEKVLDWIYKDATIFLKRKYEYYQELKQYNIQTSSSKVNEFNSVSSASETSLSSWSTC